MHFFTLDIRFGIDEDFKISNYHRSISELEEAQKCCLCDNPTAVILKLEPLKAGLKLALKTPPGMRRVLFFPLCLTCHSESGVKEELKWKATEQLHTNVSIEPMGFGLYH